MRSVKLAVAILFALCLFAQNSNNPQNIVVGNAVAVVIKLPPVGDCVVQFYNLVYVANTGSEYYCNTLTQQWTQVFSGTIASGNLILTPGAISAETCEGPITASATGILITDTLDASFNGDPTSTSGFIPGGSGPLTIISYPSLNQANFKVCNYTQSSVTLGNITVNWRVAR